MDVFDMIGPVMIGPSSSHTAGAAKIGYLAQQELGERVQEAVIEMHGSYASAKGYKTFEEWFPHIAQYTEKLKEQARQQNTENNGYRNGIFHIRLCINKSQWNSQKEH